MSQIPAGNALQEALLQNPDVPIENKRRSRTNAKITSTYRAVQRLYQHVPQTHDHGILYTVKAILIISVLAGPVFNRATVSHISKRPDTMRIVIPWVYMTHAAYCYPNKT